MADVKTEITLVDADEQDNARSQGGILELRGLHVDMSKRPNHTTLPEVAGPTNSAASTQSARFMDPILAKVRRQLQASPFAAIKQLETEFRDGVLILRGKVPTFHTPQVALAVVMKVPGVRQVDDRIVVETSRLVSNNEPSRFQ